MLPGLSKNVIVISNYWYSKTFKWPSAQRIYFYNQFTKYYISIQIYRYMGYDAVIYDGGLVRTGLRNEYSFPVTGTIEYLIRVPLVKPWAPSQYPKRRLSVRSRKVSKLRDLYLELSDRSEIWQALRQQCCRCACQISKRYDNLKYQSRGFETLRDLTKRRLFWYWDGAQGATDVADIVNHRYKAIGVASEHPWTAKALQRFQIYLIYVSDVIFLI